MSDPTLLVVIHALAEQHKHPERHGGGLIGKAVAVCEALGLDPDADWQPPAALREGREPTETELVAPSGVEGVAQ